MGRVSAFKGFDYESGQHFEGKVSAKDVEVFYYESGMYYNYSL